MGNRGIPVIALAGWAVAAGCAHGRRAEPATGAPVAAPDEALKSCAGLDARAAFVRLRELEGQAGGGETRRQAAELALGQALYCGGFYSEALATFDRSVDGSRTSLDRSIADALSRIDDKTPTRAVPAEALRWLVFVSRRFPGWDQVLQPIAACQRTDLERPELADVRDDLLYLGGLARYRQGRLSEAVELFALIPATSPLAVKARLFEGATHVRGFQAGPAVAAFKEALRISEASSDPRLARFRELANISLARTFYSTGQFDLAIKHYDQIPAGSTYAGQRLFEAAWANFMIDNHARALEHLRALDGLAGDVAPEVMAEALLLKAAMLSSDGFQLQATAAIDAFNATVPPLFQQLKTMLETTPDDVALFNLAAKVRAGASGLPPTVHGAIRQVTSDRAMARRFERVFEIQDELARYGSKTDAGWKTSELGQVVLADLTLRQSEAVEEAGDLFRRRIRRLTDELAQQIRRLIQIPWEPLRAGT